MEEINIKELLEFFFSKRRIIVLITVLAVLVGAIYSLVFVKPEYTAKTTLILTGTAEATNKANGVIVDGVQITQNDINLNSKLVATYREIIKSKTVLKDVINTLNLDYSTDNLAKKISVSTVADTEMISITVKTNKADESAAIANELVDKFADQIKKAYNIENISVVDKAEIPTVPTNANIVKQIVIYALIGLVLGFAVAFAMFYFDTTLKDSKQIEKMGFTVLTSVPEKQKEGGRK